MRLEKTFKDLTKKNRSAFITFLTAGDPDYATSKEILEELPKSGVDIIEIGFPFSDPMADGPSIQASSLRALNNGMTLKKTIDLVKEFRKQNDHTPIVLMGYYNPIYIYGNEKFLQDAKSAGVDGLIVVDLPPEEDHELCEPANHVGLNFIRLCTPTTDEKRLPAVLKNTSGFLYYVSIAGITGTKTPEFAKLIRPIQMLKDKSNLPVAVGFGIKTVDNAKEVAKLADGVVIGSSIVDIIQTSLNDQKDTETIKNSVLKYVKELSEGIKLART